MVWGPHCQKVKSNCFFPEAWWSQFLSANTKTKKKLSICRSETEYVTKCKKSSVSVTTFKTIITKFLIYIKDFKNRNGPQKEETNSSVTWFSDSVLCNLHIDYLVTAVGVWIKIATC